jgi:hypothetical protein
MIFSNGKTQNLAIKHPEFTRDLFVATFLPAKMIQI